MSCPCPGEHVRAADHPTKPAGSTASYSYCLGSAGYQGADPRWFHVIESLHAAGNQDTLIDTPKTALQQLPSWQVLADLLETYFQSLTFMIDVVHEEAFSLTQQLPPKRRFLQGQSSPMHIFPALVLSMLALSARNHALNAAEPHVAIALYDRAKRFALSVIDTPSLLLLQALLHMTLFCIQQSDWSAAYVWLGNAVTGARALKIVEGKRGLRDGCWDWVEVAGMKLGDIRVVRGPRMVLLSSSAGSLRFHMIDDKEICSMLLLPTPNSVFYASRQNSPPMPLTRTMVLNDFLSAVPTALASNLTGVNGFLCAIATLFDRVTRFRHDCERRGVLPFLVDAASGQGSNLGARMLEIEGDCERWFERLPEHVRCLDRGPDADEFGLQAWSRWLPKVMDATYDWGVDLLIYHATMVTLHGERKGGSCALFGICNLVQGFKETGPSYNLMVIAKQLAPCSGPFGSADPAITEEILNSSALDELLTAWQTSKSFLVALDHADRGITILEEMNAYVSPERRRDTPFFGYSLCQLGLVMLLGARQSTLADAYVPLPSPPARSATIPQHERLHHLPLLSRSATTNTLHSRAAIIAAALGDQGHRFAGSRTGEKLLRNMMAEIAGGEMTLGILADLQRKGIGIDAAAGQAVASQLVRRAMGRSTEDVFESPGLCAGSMLREAGKT
ncbi:hypothetical protein BDK51DRAFT_47917 [Blyttiomyces helicus]|uniref:Xylanolytic transcriptional activator regulatory domain-containing protein n=1 Tax=Blyttiomyces helicus TaxID=388810 RepID=A0A4P9W831_9FUNG|nr:hypothetical protein BDK51DRAFT_47917 [Blyttiomyces helicus]|eukprot:RKO88659.1 hypothetical protein BDK51DRAFT_47917 [Blyttiomyces helicus]